MEEQIFTDPKVAIAILKLMGRSLGSHEIFLIYNCPKNSYGTGIKLNTSHVQFKIIDKQLYGISESNYIWHVIL